MKVFKYSRVSTNSQDYKRQTEKLLEFSKNMNYEVLIRQRINQVMRVIERIVAKLAEKRDLIKM